MLVGEAVNDPNSEFYLPDDYVFRGKGAEAELPRRQLLWRDCQLHVWQGAARATLVRPDLLSSRFNSLEQLQPYCSCRSIAVALH